MGELLSRSSPTPPQELADKGLKKQIRNVLTYSRREDKPRSCSRKLTGATETLLARKLVLHSGDS